VEHDVPLDEHLDVGPTRSRNACTCAPARMKNEVSFVTPEKPFVVVVDPDFLRIDRSRADNLKRLE